MLWSERTWLRRLAAVIETGNLLFLKLMFRDFARARLLPQAVHNEYMALARDDVWTTRDVQEVFPELEEGCQISLRYLPGHRLSTDLREMTNLALVTRAVDPDAIFEIGTYRGRSALNFALNCQDDCEVYTLDIPPEQRGRAMKKMHEADRKLTMTSETGVDYHGYEVSNKITQLYGDSQTFDFSPYADSIDLVYVDGAHHYDCVRGDTENALEMLRPGGAILWDDFGQYGDYFDVTRAVFDVVGRDRVTQLGATNQAVYRAPGPAPPGRAGGSV